MDVSTLLLWFGLFWAVVHVLHRYVQHKVQTRSVLPTISHRKDDKYRVYLHGLRLRVEIYNFNRVHDTFSQRLRRQLHKRYALSLLYDLGSIFSFAGMLLSVLGLAVVMVKMIHGVWFSFDSTVDSSVASTNLFKRDTSSNEPIGTLSRGQGVPIHFLIPGVTIPLFHLLPLLLALFICQIVHEIGHALSAAIDSIPLLSMGAEIMVCLPLAFVSLPSAAVCKLSPRARLRVVSAGASHNLIFWVLLAILPCSPLLQVLWSFVGYENVAHNGRVISGISPESPLRAHLPVGALVTHLNDESLASISEDVWTRHLSETKTYPGRDLGWCAESSWFEAQPDSCCSVHNPESGASCFTSSRSPRTAPHQRCLPSLSLLNSTSPLGNKRCHDAIDCDNTHICVRPRADEELLRIRLWFPEYMLTDTSKQEVIVLWSGPKEEVLEDVEVGVYLPRWRFLPLWLPTWGDAFLEYLSTLTLSLYFFNLLPVSFLDGGQFLDAILDLLSDYSPSSQRHIFELQDVETGRQGASGTSFSHSSHLGRKWKGIILSTSSYGVSGAVVLCMILSLLGAIR